MTKNDVIVLVNELRENVMYPDADDVPLHGLGLPDFQKGKHIRKEAIVKFLNWQCRYLGGGFDEEELTECLRLLKVKRVVMI